MKRLCILAATVAMFFCGNLAGAQQQGGKDKNAASQADRRERGQQKGGGGGPQEGGGQSGLFRLLDVNRDGNLSQTEIDGAVAALMKLDANKDGALDAQELTISGGRRRGGQRGGVGGRNKGPRNQSAKKGN